MTLGAGLDNRLVMRMLVAWLGLLTFQAWGVVFEFLKLTSTGVLPIQGRRFASIRLQVMDGLGYFFADIFSVCDIPRKIPKKNLVCQRTQTHKTEKPGQSARAYLYEFIGYLEPAGLCWIFEWCRRGDSNSHGGTPTRP